jgi:aminoglycoside 3-N-acetyltransferase I
MANGAVEVRRLVLGEEGVAREMFAMMVAVFAEDEDGRDDRGGELGDEDVAGLLRRGEFWALVATEEGVVVGGLTAHVLPMTRNRSSELFLYDLAVRTDRRRRGIGRALVEELLALAKSVGIRTTFVPADDEDTHALDFYRALGGAASPVTFFTFSR